MAVFMALISNFHEQVGHNGANGRSHSYFMYLFKLFNLEDEMHVFKTELQQCRNVMHRHGCSVV